MQFLTIVASRGNVYLLASLYAFGVIWSFAFKSLAVVVLRFTEPENREWKVPGNFHIGGVEIPLGLALISLLLFATAVVNLFTKELATISGVAFSLAFFAIFTISERITAKQHAHAESGLDQFNIAQNAELSAAAMEVRPGNVLVAMRDPRNLYYLRERAGQDRHHQERRRGHDLAHLSSRSTPSAATRMMDTSELFGKYEQELFYRRGRGGRKSRASTFR